MTTIVEPEEYIANLWGKQEIKKNETYRLMKFVLRADFEGKILLHNVVTGKLVLLSSVESKKVEKMPILFCSALEQLVKAYFVVPIDYDENDQVNKLRGILRALDETKKAKEVITHYTILPTTACNAQCYYCFEKGSKIETMTESTADNVVKYIVSHCDENKNVKLSWFGGEPTLAAHCIDYICMGLQRERIDYQSDITTNGYLLDGVMIEKAIRLWNLKSCMICVDGTEDTYNRVKGYSYSSGSAYQRIMNNIALLLKNKIWVNLRMNFDLENYLQFPELVEDLLERFGRNPFLQVHAHPIFGEHKNLEGKIVHATEDWFTMKVVELNEIAVNAGVLYHKHELPSIEFRACQASSINSVGISPNGALIRCPEKFGEMEETGNVIDGVTNPELLDSWNHYSNPEMCKDCVLFPICQRNERCMAREVCCYKKENIKNFQRAMLYAMKSKMGGDVV